MPIQQVILAGLRSHDDFGLFLELGWELETPAIKSIYVNLPASDGSIDLTESLAGEPRYYDRRFYFSLGNSLPYEQFIALYHQIRNRLHGLRARIVPPYRVGWHLMGRISVGDFEYEGNRGTIHFTCHCDPWLTRDTATRQVIVVDGTWTGTLTNPARKTALPSVTNTAPVTLTYGPVTRVISPGTWRFTNFLLRQGVGVPLTIRGQTPNILPGQGLSTPRANTAFWFSLGAVFTPLTDGWIRVDTAGNPTGNHFCQMRQNRDSEWILLPNRQYRSLIECRMLVGVELCVVALGFNTSAFGQQLDTVRLRQPGTGSSIVTTIAAPMTAPNATGTYVGHGNVDIAEFRMFIHPIPPVGIVKNELFGMGYGTPFGDTGFWSHRGTTGTVSSETLADGWIRCTATGSGGRVLNNVATGMVQYLPNTVYTIVCEVRNMTGEVILEPNRVSLSTEYPFSPNVPFFVTSNGTFTSLVTTKPNPGAMSTSLSFHFNAIGVASCEFRVAVYVWDRQAVTPAWRVGWLGNYPMPPYSNLLGDSGATGFSTPRNTPNFYARIDGGVTPLADGWARFVNDQTTPAITTNATIRWDAKGLSPNTTYTYIISCRTATGTGEIAPNTQGSNVNWLTSIIDPIAIADQAINGGRVDRAMVFRTTASPDNAGGAVGITLIATAGTVCTAEIKGYLVEGDLTGSVAPSLVTIDYTEGEL